MNAPTKLIRTDWDACLREEEVRLGFHDGFKVLYCPWNTLRKASAAFVSLNPGRPPDDADLRVVSDERGNSYEVERHTTKSPITAQFLSMCAYLNLAPTRVLTGAAFPFRSDRWTGISSLQKKGGLSIGRAFWSLALRNKEIPLIITCGDEATSTVSAAMNARFEDELLSGWGNVKLRLHSTRSGARIVQLPHLSTFKLFSRPECEAALSRALRMA